MPVPISALEPGKCYLTQTGHVRRVVRLMPDGRVQFEARRSHTFPKSWKIGIEEGHIFVRLLVRQVPCDWTPETEEL